MTIEEARLTLQDNFGYLSQEHPRILEALRVALDVLSQPSLPSSLDEAAELSANDAMIKRQFPSVVYNTGLKCFDHADLIKQFKAGAEWMAGQGVSAEGDTDNGLPDGYYISLEDYLESLPKGTELVLQLRKK